MVKYRSQQRYKQSPAGKYAEFKAHAKYRGIEFNLSREEFSAYWQAPCHYCGHQIQTVGLDRVDSNAGYVKENIVPCCRYCNTAKNDLTQAQFLGLCSNIVRKHGFVYADI